MTSEIAITVQPKELSDFSIAYDVVIVPDGDWGRAIVLPAYTERDANTIADEMKRLIEENSTTVTKTGRAMPWKKPEPLTQLGGGTATAPSPQSIRWISSNRRGMKMRFKTIRDVRPLMSGHTDRFNNLDTFKLACDAVWAAAKPAPGGMWEISKRQADAIMDAYVDQEGES